MREKSFKTTKIPSSVQPYIYNIGGTPAVRITCYARGTCLPFSSPYPARWAPASTPPATFSPGLPLVRSPRERRPKPPPRRWMQGEATGGQGRPGEACPRWCCLWFRLGGVRPASKGKTPRVPGLRTCWRLGQGSLKASEII